METSDGVSIALSLIVTLGGSAAFWAYWKDRKKSRADGIVANATIELQVDHSRMQNLEQRFALSEKAWDEERESWQNRLSNVESELAAEKRRHAETTERLNADIQSRDDMIVGLQRRMMEFHNEVEDLMAELESLRLDRPDSPGTIEGKE